MGESGARERGGAGVGAHVCAPRLAEAVELVAPLVHQAEIVEDDEPPRPPSDGTDVEASSSPSDSGDELGAVLLAALAGRPHVGDDGDAGLLERLAACEQVIAALQSAQVEALAEFGRRRATQFAGEPEPPAQALRARKDFAVEELTARLSWTAWTAAHRLDEAERLATCLPDTWSALAQGRLDYPRVRRIVNATRSLSEDDAAAVDTAVADRAGGLTTAQLDELLAVEVTAVDPAAAARRAKTAATRRRVGVQPCPDGQALLLAEGPAADVLTIMTALTAAAGPPRPGDERGVDARRFDALRDWAGVALSRPAPDDGGGSGSPPWRPHVLLTVALTTILGLDQHPGHLHGYGPLPAEITRQITTDATVRRLLTDPITGLVVGIDGHTYPGGLQPPPPDHPDDPDDPDDPGGGAGDGGPGDGGGGAAPAPKPPAAPAAGQHPEHAFTPPRPCPVTAAGGGRYRPGRLVDRFIRHRDLTCTAPGCRRTAMRCDLDHILAHPTGPTCPCNLHPLCRRHHRMKHRSGATVTRRPDGTTVWTMPTGHVYTRPARPPLHRPLVTVRTPPSDHAHANTDADVDAEATPRHPAHDTAAHDIAALRAAIEAPPAPPVPTATHSDPTDDPFAGPPPF